MEYFNEKTAEQLTLVAIFKAKAGRGNALKQALMALIDKTRAEKGAVSYHLYEDREDAKCFIFHEIWANEELWKKHMQSDHIKNMLTTTATLLNGEPQIQKMERSQASTPIIDKNALVLFAYNRAKAGKEEEWQKILEDLIPATLAEDGALHYELHRSKEDSRNFMFHETWQTVESWNEHMKAPHLIHLLKIIGNYTENGINVIKTRAID